MATASANRRRQLSDGDDNEEERPAQRRRLDPETVEDVTMAELPLVTNVQHQQPHPSRDDEFRQSRAIRIAEERERLRREQQQERERVRERIFNQNRRSTTAAMETVTQAQPERTSSRKQIVPLPDPVINREHITIDVVPYQRMLHFKHVMRVLDVCTTGKNGAREWCGLSTFLKYYFASTLKIFLGESAVVRIFLMHSEHEIGAKLYRIGNDRYVLSLLANFDYWEKISTIAASLPDIYFRPMSDVPVVTNDASRDFTLAGRVQVDQLHDYGTTQESSLSSSSACRRENNAVEYSLLNDDVRIPVVSAEDQVNEPTTAAAAVNHENDQENEDLESTNVAVIDKALMSLCLVHLFEIYIQRDLKTKVPNYITLAKLFSDNPEAINPFRVELRSR
jgi:hypothetical protein